MVRCDIEAQPAERGAELEAERVAGNPDLFMLIKLRGGRWDTRQDDRKVDAAWEGQEDTWKWTKNTQRVQVHP